MRITRESLLRLTRTLVDLRVRGNRRLVCVYLTGSLIGEEALLGGTTDIDLIFVHSDEPPVHREVERVNDDVHLDIAHFSQSVFQHPRGLRADPWLGTYLCENPIVLHDVQHWFDFTQASVCAHFYQPETVWARVRPMSDVARQSWLNLEAGEQTSAVDFLNTYLSVMHSAANTLACLNGGPLTERRFLLKLPERTQAVGKPELFGAFVDLLWPQPVEKSQWEPWAAAWKSCLTEASEQPGCPTRFKACRVGYYTRAADAMFDEYPSAALWLMLRTWTQVLGLFPALSGQEDWAQMTAALNLSAPHHEERLRQLDGYLDSVEETLDEWARANGIESL